MTLKHQNKFDFQFYDISTFDQHSESVSSLSPGKKTQTAAAASAPPLFATSIWSVWIDVVCNGQRKSTSSSGLDSDVSRGNALETT